MAGGVAFCAPSLGGAETPSAGSPAAGRVVLELPFACEPDARAQIERRIEMGGDGWKELTDLYRHPDR